MPVVEELRLCPESFPEHERAFSVALTEAEAEELEPPEQTIDALIRGRLRGGGEVAVGVILMDAAGRWQKINGAAQALLGLRRYKGLTGPEILKAHRGLLCSGLPEVFQDEKPSAQVLTGPKGPCCVALGGLLKRNGELVGKLGVLIPLAALLCECGEIVDLLEICDRIHKVDV